MSRYLKLAGWFLIGLAVLFLGLRLVGKFFAASLVSPPVADKIGGGAEKALVGQEAPYFNLSKISGGSVNRSELSGAPAVLVFWATWQSESADQIKILDDYRNHPASVPVKVIAINSQEDQSVVLSFIRRGGYGVEVALDPTGELGNRYGLQILPMSFFIDRDGVVREIFTGVMSEAELVDKIENILK